jgi:hypothetical protein
MEKSIEKNDKRMDDIIFALNNLLVQPKGLALIFDNS